MKRTFYALGIICMVMLLSGCVEEETHTYPTVDREDAIPAGTMKITPEMDEHPPILHVDVYKDPVPMPYPLNTAGAEDSPFITPDGRTFYVWFTPDPNAPLEEQLHDNVTGIYVSQKENGQWSTPKRVWLQDPDTLVLDGCVYVQGNKMWFCTTREGCTGMCWFTAEFVNGNWTNWKKAEFNLGDDVGELHISSDGNELYFHSSRSGGKGSNDIWVSHKRDGEWQEPENIAAVNTSVNESRPFLTEDGTELWFTRTYKGTPAVFRSKKVNGAWQEPELIISQFAGEPTLDDDGNIYFVHHFFKEGKMVEADIYVAYKK